MSKPPATDIPESDRALWQQVMQDVKPIKSAPPPKAKLKSPAPESVSPPPPALAAGEEKRAPEKPVSEKKPAPKILGPLPALNAVQRLALKEGRWPLARLDLHGYHESAAHAALCAFIMQQAAAGQRAVLIITGKGDASNEQSRGARSEWEKPETPGSLRKFLPLWLEAPELRGKVQALEPAAAKHGGLGAYYVVLKREKI